MFVGGEEGDGGVECCGGGKERAGAGLVIDGARGCLVDVPRVAEFGAVFDAAEVGGEVMAGGGEVPRPGN